MTKYVKEFFHRGLMFAGFGPVILGIIYAILERTAVDFYVSGTQVCLGICSIYLLAFVHAGASVFNQIEEWPLAKSVLCHFLTLYVAYSVCYLVNTWIPFEPMVLLIFTAVFVVGYFVVWTVVVLTIKLTSKKLNSKLT